MSMFNNNYGIEKIMAMSGATDDDDIDTQLDKVAQLLTTVLNQISNLKMDYGYAWKISFTEGGLKTKFSKMYQDKEVGWVIINTNPYRISYSNPNDEDLKKFGGCAALGLLMDD